MDERKPAAYLVTFTNQKTDMLQPYLDLCRVKPGNTVNLKDFKTAVDDKPLDKDDAPAMQQQLLEKVRDLQDKLYAADSHSVLLVIQALDAAGKDSLVKHVMSGINPTGVKVHPFKAPTHTELEHDYLWRHNLALPGRGEIGIFIRSHYENVLVCRVHPEYVLNEHIPGISSVDKVNDAFFKNRFRQINNWEQHLSENGLAIIKIFLYQSAEEQREQLLERIDDASKNWKFNVDDVAEAGLRKEYLAAYEDMLGATSTAWAPWYVLPADNKWFTRLLTAQLLHDTLDGLNLAYPVLPQKQAEQLQEAKAKLMQ